MKVKFITINEASLGIVNPQEENVTMPTGIELTTEKIGIFGQIESFKVVNPTPTLVATKGKNLS